MYARGILGWNSTRNNTLYIERLIKITFSYCETFCECRANEHRLREYTPGLLQY